MQRWILCLMTGLLVGCASSSAPGLFTLSAPPGTLAESASRVEQGNKLFAARNWTAAEQIYRQTIAADATLAEAHYNLALTLDRLGDQVQAKKHYKEAANLVPGHKIIWDAPPLRDATKDNELRRKSFLDANPR